MAATTHGACGDSWTGSGYAHCSGCCTTFGSTRVFDGHRTTRGEHGSCTDPAKVLIGGQRLRLIDDVWHGPAMQAGALAAKRAA